MIDLVDYIYYLKKIPLEELEQTITLIKKKESQQTENKLIFLIKYYLRQIGLKLRLVKRKPGIKANAFRLLILERQLAYESVIELNEINAYFNDLFTPKDLYKFVIRLNKNLKEAEQEKYKRKWINIGCNIFLHYHNIIDNSYEKEMGKGLEIHYDWP